MLRALLIQVFFSVRSERQIVERLDYNLLFRWFVGLNLDDPIATKDDLPDLLPMHLFDLTTAEGKRFQSLHRREDVLHPLLRCQKSVPGDILRLLVHPLREPADASQRSTSRCMLKVWLRVCHLHARWAARNSRVVRSGCPRVRRMCHSATSRFGTQQSQAAHWYAGVNAPL
jgi:hypothetical protein